MKPARGKTAPGAFQPNPALTVSGSYCRKLLEAPSFKGAKRLESCYRENGSRGACKGIEVARYGKPGQLPGEKQWAYYARQQAANLNATEWISPLHAKVKKPAASTGSNPFWLFYSCLCSASR
ncbi:hypothetical protein C1N53_21400 [Pontibacter sp. SGAir0037]|nr:hypothetical protein C1N53_21400 [Pontibacter sp. SGAir0037]